MRWTFPEIKPTWLAALGVLGLLLYAVGKPNPPQPQPVSPTTFQAPPPTPDLSGTISSQLDKPADFARALTEPGSGTPTQALPPGDAIQQHLMRYGTPVAKHDLAIGGLTAWTVVAKNGRAVELYTTPDGQAVFSGVVWNLQTGQKVSNALTDVAQAQPMQQQGASSGLVSGRGALPAAFDGPVPTQIPEAIQTVSTLAGYTEGKGSVADTLYVIIDPRCPYCRRAYNNTREYVKNGVTIKWIPTAALGEDGIPLAATVLESKDKAVIDGLLARHEFVSTKPSETTLKELHRNLDFLFEAFKQNGGERPGVPVAFFIDRRTGKPRMVSGVSEQVVIEDILGQPNKVRK